jgi:hypothetical protein
MHKSVDEVEALVEKRSLKMQATYREKGLLGRFREGKKLRGVIDKHWEPGMYDRSYLDLSGNNVIKSPNPVELEQVHRSMRKFSDKDMYNCCACGYNDCEAMAIAIFNGLNKPENCHHFKQSRLQEEMDHVGLLKTESEQRMADEVVIAANVSTALAQMVSANAIIAEMSKSLLRTFNEQKRFSGYSSRM